MKMKFCKIALLLGVMATSQGVIAQTAAEDYKITLSGTAADGYCNARLLWTTECTKALPTGMSWRVLSSQVYRNNVLIKSDIPWSTYIDDNLSQGATTYKVVAKVEYTTSSKDTEGNTVLDYKTLDVTSNTISLNIAARNSAKVKYRIEEIYNFRIGEENKANSYDGTRYIPTWTASTTNVPRFMLTDFVRGAYHIISKRDGKGYWFFVDNTYGNWTLSDLSMRENYEKIYKVADDPASLTDPSKYQLVLQVEKKNLYGSTVTTPNFAYIAVDEYENIFAKAGPSYFYAAPTNYQIFKYDQYRTNVNASPWKTGTISKNLTEFALKADGQPGRCDKISVKGSLDAGESSIMMSPGQGPYCFRLKLNNGNKVSETWAKPTVDSESEAKCFNAENEAIFVNGVDDVDRIIYEHRSNFYTKFDFDKNASGDVTSSSNSKVLDYISAPGQVNQAGVSTLYFKGTAANGVQCNDMFLASSMSFNSITAGSFQVNLSGTSADKASATAKDFDFSSMAPLATFAQREEYIEGTAANTNLSSIFFTKENDGTGKYHIYLYQYVPGYRIAKYEIIPQIGVAETPISITIDKIEPVPGIGTGIVGFDNYMTFQKPAYGEGATDDYEVKGYSIILTDSLGNYYKYQIGAKSSEKDGKKVYYCRISQADQNGNIKTDASGNPLPVQKYNEKGFPVVDKDGNPVYYDKYQQLPDDYTGSVGDFVHNFKLPFPLTSLGDYTAQIAVWVGRKGQDEYIECEPSTSTIPVTLETRIPTVDTKTYRYDADKDNQSGSILSSNGDHPYRVDASFDMPGGPDPVSYYEVWIDKNDGNGPQKYVVEPYSCYKTDESGNILIDAQGNKVTGNPDLRKDEKRGIWIIENGLPTYPANTKAPGQCPKYTAGKSDDTHTAPEREATDRIPGDYDFVNDPGYATGGGQEAGEKDNTIFSVYLSAPEVDKTGKTEQQIIEEQNNIVKDYKICVRPVYASETAFETRTNGCGSAGIPGTTGVEAIDADNAIQVYPIPAESEVNIAAPFEINEVKFFSVSGSVVKVAKFDGNENEVTISVDDLTTGFYYISINGRTSQKFIKR